MGNLKCNTCGREETLERAKRVCVQQTDGGSFHTYICRWCWRKVRMMRMGPVPRILLFVVIPALVGVGFAQAVIYFVR